MPNETPAAITRPTRTCAAHHHRSRRTAAGPVATLRYWRHLGTDPTSFHLGRRVLYRRDDLHAWIDARRDHRTPPAP